MSNPFQPSWKEPALRRYVGCSDLGSLLYRTLAKTNLYRNVFIDVCVFSLVHTCELSKKKSGQIDCAGVCALLHPFSIPNAPLPQCWCFKPATLVHYDSLSNYFQVFSPRLYIPVSKFLKSRVSSRFLREKSGQIISPKPERSGHSVGGFNSLILFTTFLGGWPRPIEVLVLSCPNPGFLRLSPWRSPFFRRF